MTTHVHNQKFIFKKIAFRDIEVSALLKLMGKEQFSGSYKIDDFSMRLEIMIVILIFLKML